MSKHVLLESILNDEYVSIDKEKKGVCQKCGHYTRLTDCKFGTRICRPCKNTMENSGAEKSL